MHAIMERYASCLQVFSNDKVTPERILKSHQQQTLKRMSEFDTVLLIQDTSAVMSKNLKEEAYVSSTNQKGMLIHLTLAITPNLRCFSLQKLA